MKIEKKFTKSGKEAINMYKNLLKEKNSIFHVIFLDVDMNG